MVDSFGLWPQETGTTKEETRYDSDEHAKKKMNIRQPVKWLGNKVRHSRSHDNCKARPIRKQHSRQDTWQLTNDGRDRRQVITVM